MSDTADAGATIDTAPPAEVVASTPVETAAPAAASATVSTDTDPFDTSDLGTDGIVPRGRYDKVAKEGQAYREQARSLETQLSEYEKVYGQYAPEDRDTWFAMANEWARDPRAGAEMMQRIAEAVLSDGSTPQEATEKIIAEDQVNAAADEAGIELTPERVAQIVEEKIAADRAERENEAQIDAQVKAIFAEVEAAGYEPDSDEGQFVMLLASRKTGGDISKAIEIVKARDQKVIDDYVAGKTGNQTPRPAPTNGVLATSAPVINTLDEAFASANRYLDGLKD